MAPCVSDIISLSLSCVSYHTAPNLAPERVNMNWKELPQNSLLH